MISTTIITKASNQTVHGIRKRFFFPRRERASERGFQNESKTAVLVRRLKSLHHFQNLVRLRWYLC